MRFLHVKGLLPSNKLLSLDSTTMDRGYNDYKLFAAWTENGIYFFTRMKENAGYTVVEERTIPITGNVLRDQLVRFKSKFQ